jgi:cytidylate kinase
MLSPLLQATIHYAKHCPTFTLLCIFLQAAIRYAERRLRQVYERLQRRRQEQVEQELLLQDFLASSRSKSSP